MTPTPNQLEAITAEGNLLVVAAAGAGKTGTLVERCTRLLLDANPPISIRNLLIVTFTEAAAAEVRHRVRQKLEERALAEPDNDHLQLQLAQIDSAYISTLHSFCFELVRNHVLHLDIDPSVSVLQPEQAKVLFLNTLELLMNEHYQGVHDISGELKDLIQEHFRGWDQPVRNLIERLHEFTQTRPNPERWLDQMLDFLSRPKCPQWHTWYTEALQDWRAWWVPFLRSQPPDFKNAHACANILDEGCAKADLELAARIEERDAKECWGGRVTDQRRVYGKLFNEAAFLASLLPEKAGDQPLEQDWEWMRRPLLTILRFARQFADRFREEKRQRGVVDFHDLEQLALQLLIDPHTQEPTPIAREWQERFKAVFVDEYQDINAAQDLILSALSSAVPPGNRFLVGDMKQSIYRFRQADPRIFRTYLGRENWRTIHLSENFRSHEGILRFVNPLFRWLMRPEVGGLAYGEDEALQFGGAETRAEMKAVPGEVPVELHVLYTDEDPGVFSETEGEEEAPELDNAEAEARLVATRLRELKDRGFTIFHQKEKRRRPVEWKDMVVLLRAARNKLETYAKAFAAEGVPLQTKRNAFFTTQEVLDLCNLLYILDNPLQDIPLAGVLRSPLVGLSANELASIRIHSREKVFWHALQQFSRSSPESSTKEKVNKFLQRFEAWRDPRVCSSLTQRLDAILCDTGYEDWLLTQPRGRERHANVRQLLRLAREFDESRGQSLYVFLRHIEELQDAVGDIEPAGCADENAVRLMTIHQSKGLEFPVVAVADLGKRFNLVDRTGGIAIHEKYGLCSMIKPPHTGQRYLSLPLWLTRREERLEAIGEEMRVLYVALTRAQNHLLLFGSSTRKAPERWADRANLQPLPPMLCRHQSLLDWLGCFAWSLFPGWTTLPENKTDLFSFRFHDQPSVVQGNDQSVAPPINAEVRCVEPLNYPHMAATRQAAKSSVTALRQRSEQDEEVRLIRFRGEKGGTERGSAVHTFLELVSVDAAPVELTLRAEARRLVDGGVLTVEEAAYLDFDAIAAFWNSDIGASFLRYPQQIHRELPFTFKAAKADLQAAGLPGGAELPDDDFIVIQGIADLIRIAPEEMWLIDFKTDRLSPGELKNATERYRPQILLYALALGAIYKRPVTKKAIFYLELRKFVWL